jgi:hypothetical protein
LVRDEKNLIFWQMIKTHPEYFPVADMHGYIYDDQDCMYTAKQLSFELVSHTHWTTQL